MSPSERTTRNQKSSKSEKKSVKTTTASISAPSMAKSVVASKAGGAAETSMEDILRSIEKSNQEIRGEIQLMREDVKEFKGQISESFNRLETSVGGLSTQLTTLEKRVVDAEGRIGDTEEKAAIHGRAISFLLQQEAELMERCEDLQNRARRQNLRLYQIPEGSEGRDMVAFIKKLLPTVLPSLPLKEDDIRIDRAHRTLTPRSKEGDPLRPILVGFADYTVKEQILRQAWTQGQVKMGDRQIYFDNDYSPELQRKRAQVRYVIKELKQKNVKAKCLYPARLRMMVGSVEKTFPTLMEAAPALQKMNIQIRVDERDKLQSELTRRRWERQDNRRGKNGNLLSEEDCRVFFPGNG
ncbi:LINE-1 retrotransposable element ORF1 protein [Dissostichus eleginoides]|uniref:LINE-1 retrotransposable element ORF1 protein n=1 Tax=Dissostichus eleginoides TaxID=100907 RepID=A0AAD9BSD9_DISEL|nr:LINE-1 retrotransposable element ORF1 protein [Dissostichus eleginoides]